MKTRPGLDRIDKQELTASKTRLTMSIETHVDHCLTCQQSGNYLRKRCDTWWGLARSLHQVKRGLRRYDVPETAGMETLPGMDEL